MGIGLFVGEFVVVHLQVVLSYVQITGMVGQRQEKKSPN
jgi:hypothetical protein